MSKTKTARIENLFGNHWVIPVRWIMGRESGKTTVTIQSDMEQRTAA